ncbi:unnamed protein product, partial [Candidula unifasciata]
IIKAATRLRVTVSRVGRIPSSHSVHEAYRWTDPRGRPVSPPLDRGGSAPGDDDERRRSGSQMLKASDERKINIVLQKGQGLGILIRGGKEYGLGIFVSGIDPYSVAENAGMKKIFSRGVGTQLMLTSSMGKVAQKEQIYEQARLLLNDSEHATLNYYLSEYEKKTINIRGMAHALLELLNTPAKLTLMSEIRATVRPADLATFDQLIAKSDLEKSLNQARKLLAPDMISLSSFDSEDVIDMEKYKRTMFSHPRSDLLKSQPMDILHFDDSAEMDSDSYDLLETSQRLSRSTPNLTNIGQTYNSQEQTTSRRRSRSPWAVFSTNRKSKSKEALWNTDSRAEIGNSEADFIKTKMDYPSDDSGVEINGHAQKDSQSASHS